MIQACSTAIEAQSTAIATQSTTVAAQVRSRAHVPLKPPPLRGSSLLSHARVQSVAVAAMIDDAAVATATKLKELATAVELATTPDVACQSFPAVFNGVASGGGDAVGSVRIVTCDPGLRCPVES
jgi:hypothetical protein